jgi:16S rRNA (cytidine1402-2'-O)-methyltransferase
MIFHYFRQENEMTERNSEQGTLYLVSTPIGNLGDMTFRAVDTLRSCDLIAAEDTRRASILLRHYGIEKNVTSYHAFNEHRKTDQLLGEVAKGRSIAVITDAGTPGVSDPGFLLVREALKRGIEPIIVPGVSALTFAATGAGFPTDRFAFIGFLPVKSGRRRAAIEAMAHEERTVFFFESPHKIAATIRLIEEILGPETRIAVIREATKIHEEILRGTVAEIRARTAERNWKGECTIAIDVRSGSTVPMSTTVLSP